MPDGKTIKVKSVGAAKSAAGLYDEQNRKLYARIAYHYPQYTLQDVESMPYRDVALLLKTAQLIEAERMYNLTLIASAPQSDKGKGVKALTKHFKEIIDKHG